MSTRSSRRACRWWRPSSSRSYRISRPITGRAVGADRTRRLTLAPLERLSVPHALSGADGENRSTAFCYIQAKHDLDAVRAYLNRYRDQPKTLRAYTKELERFLLWAVVLRGKALSDLRVDDCEAYKDFLKSPDPRFVGERFARQSPRWRPFASTADVSAALSADSNATPCERCARRSRGGSTCAIWPAIRGPCNEVLLSAGGVLSTMVPRVKQGESSASNGMNAPTYHVGDAEESDPHGPTASKCPNGRSLRSSQANRRSKMKHTTVGVDIAKNVFQLHWVDAGTGEIMNKQMKRAAFLEHFANRAPCLIGMEACGGAHHWARQLTDGSSGQADAGEVREGVQYPQQERCGGCAGDLDGDADAEQAGRGQDRAAAGDAGAAPDARATGEIPHDADQRLARAC